MKANHIFLLIPFLMLAWGMIQALAPQGGVAEAIHEKAKATGSKRIDLRDMDLKEGWDRICISGPYTTDLMAASMVHDPEFQLSDFTPIQMHDHISAVGILEGNRVLEVAEIKRSTYDFAKYSGKCFEKSQALFE